MHQAAKPTTEATRILRVAMWCAVAAIICFVAQFLVPSAVSILFAFFLLSFAACIVALVLAFLSAARARFVRPHAPIAVLSTEAEQKSQARKLGILLALGCYFLAVMQFVSPHPPSPGRWSWLTSAVYEFLGNPGLALLWLGMGTFLLVAMGRR